MNVPVHLRPDETFVLNLGPQHPATHGVLRVKLTMDGEYIVHAEPVLGYIHWSLVDNYEWVFGYKPRFGLHSLDHVTFARTAKPSAHVLGAIARRNSL